MLNYEAPLYRPPSEGNNLIIQATIGCSFNRCSFCSMYRTKDFRVRDMDAVVRDIEQASGLWPEAHRLFIADGDALVMDMDQWRRVLDAIDRYFPRAQRITCYATPANLLKKTPAELEELRSRKLSLVYFGMESGSADILKRITKGASPKAHVEAILKAKAAGIRVSATVILGLGGRRHWEGHIEGTAQVVNEAAPTFLSTLQLYLEDIVAQEFLDKFKEPFEPQDDAGILAEQARLLELVAPTEPVIFRSNHASNCLALAGNLPRDNERLLAQIRAAQADEQMLRPSFLRGL